MTNHWNDIKNSDCILVMGANPAENHPISFKYVMEARDNGAKLICVDPRLTRTAAVSDIYTSLRSGTDIAFLGGMIKYIIDNRLYQNTYVANYTNAGFIVAQRDLELRGPGELLGTKQTGLPDYRIANLVRDAELMPGVQLAAETVMRHSPEQGVAIVRRWLGDAGRYGKV